jgi:regulator of sigma E protease
MHLIAATPWFLNPAQWLVILQVAVGLGFVIFVHELGHFLVAKACGVKCEKFYLGFDIYGLKLLKFQWGETEYGIGILPLGGYVKMLGQDDNPARMAEETRRAQLHKQQAPHDAPKSVTDSSSAAAGQARPLTHGDLPSEPVSDPHTPYDPRSYMAQSVPKRMAIISAGVIMNVIFAFIMATVAYMIGVHEVPCIVGGTVVGGAAWSAGLQPGDKVIKIGTVENPRFRDLQTGVTLGDLKDGISFTIRRAKDDRVETVVLKPDTTLGVPMIGVTGPAETQLVGDPGEHPTAPRSSARDSQPEFKLGDTFVRINDRGIESYRDIDSALARYEDEPIEVKVSRLQPKADQKRDGEQNLEAITDTIKVQPTVRRDFGLIMPLGPITAIQKGSPAEVSGLKVGDRILSVDGKGVGDPLTLESRLRRLVGKSVELSIERKSGDSVSTPQIMIKPQVPDFTNIVAPISGLPLSPIGIACEVRPIVTAVRANTPAAKSEIQPGDEIVSVKFIPPSQKDDEEDGSPSSAPIPFGKKLSWPEFMLEGMLFLAPETKVQFEIRRDGKTHLVELPSIELQDEEGDLVYSTHRGFSFAPIYEFHQAASLSDAVRLGKQETIDSLLLVYRFLRKIGQGQVPVTGVGGPVEIARQAGQAAQHGIGDLLVFLTMLSANLAVLNFLPIPLLDGGHMVFLIYEGIRRKPASERVIIAFTYAGLIFLLTLMLFVLGLDLGLISRR